jgi:hypothetical protein
MSDSEKDKKLAAAAKRALAEAEGSRQGSNANRTWWSQRPRTHPLWRLGEKGHHLRFLIPDFFFA